MSTSANRISIAALAIVTLGWANAAHASTPDGVDPKADAKAEAKPDAKADKNATDPEHPLSPVLEQAIVAKEKEVAEARREGIRLLEDYLHDSARGPEQAEALYKLAELYWEESKAAYLDKME